MIMGNHKPQACRLCKICGLSYLNDFLNIIFIQEFAVSYHKSDTYKILKKKLFRMLECLEQAYSNKYNIAQD